MRYRPFTWLDGLILAAFGVLGVAAAIASDRGFLSGMSFLASRSEPWPNAPDWFLALELPAQRVHCDFIAFLTVASLGRGLATFRRPGVARLGLRAGPGVIAVGGASAILGYHLITTLALVAYHGHWSALEAVLWMTSDPLRLLDVHAVDVTGGILGLWALLAVSGRWRARADWRDFLGRWLGCCWLGNIALDVLFPILWG